MLNGIDALTGKSNFDISESIILRLLDLFSSYRGTLAMLCKTAIARNIVQIFREKNYRVASLRALKIDAPSEFGAAVDACLFVMELGAANAERICRVASLENPANVMRVYGWSQDKFVSDVNRYLKNCELDGESPLVWRQGIKHDGASVMELNVENEETRNGLGDVVQVEEENLYWLFKSSDLRTFNAGPPTKKIIVTQTRIGQSTAHLKTTAPKLWRYLQKHAEQFEKRKSSIYRSKPRFSIFGIGDYSFTLYKVAISGFYKEPNFTLVGPIDNRPVMLDDTCYFVGFANYRDALLTATLLNSEPVKEFLSAIVFTDSKRPYTKEILMRIDLARAAELLSLEMLSDFWKRVGYQPQTVVTESDLADFKNKLSSPKVTHQLQLAI
ncbi:MAG: methyltransferase [Chloroflexi bacterium]|nr:methyltransferase [Chloroflexota bacterium]